MTTLTFSDNELNELKNFYQHELDKTLKRADDIKGIIQKLNGQTTERHLTEQKEQPATRTKRQAKISSKTKTQVIPWRKFIPKLIKKSGRHLNINEITEAAMEKFNYPDRDKLLRTLSPTLTRMTKMGKLTFAREAGQKSHYYNLPALTKTKNKKETTAATNGAVALTQ